MVVVFARHEIWSTDLLLPWMVSPAANMFIETSVKQRACGWGLQRYRITWNSWRMRVKCAFFIGNVHLCHFVALWVTSFFSHLPQKPYISSLTSLVSLSCQLIFLSPHAPFSPISSFLISPYTTLFFSFYYRFFLYFCRTDIWNPGTAEFCIFHALQSCFDSSVFFPVCCFSVACIPLFVWVVHS